MRYRNGSRRRSKAAEEGARALLYYTAGQVDRGTLSVAGAQARADCLVPMIKAWSTDIGCEVASLGIQVHGGLGFIEDSGAASGGVADIRLWLPIEGEPQPGDALELHVTAKRSGGKIWKFEGVAKVGDEIAASAEFTAMMDLKG